MDSRSRAGSTSLEQRPGLSCRKALVSKAAGGWVKPAQPLPLWSQGLPQPSMSLYLGILIPAQCGPQTLCCKWAGPFPSHRAAFGMHHVPDSHVHPGLPGCPTSPTSISASLGNSSGSRWQCKPKSSLPTFWAAWNRDPLHTHTLVCREPQLRSRWLPCCPRPLGRDQPPPLLGLPRPWTWWVVKTRHTRQQTGAGSTSTGIDESRSHNFPPTSTQDPQAPATRPAAQPG